MEHEMNSSDEEGTDHKMAHDHGMEHDEQLKYQGDILTRKSLVFPAYNS